MVFITVKIKQFIVLDNAYMCAWHCSACNLRRDPGEASSLRPEYGVANRKPVSKISNHLGLFFATTRKKVNFYF